MEKPLLILPPDIQLTFLDQLHSLSKLYLNEALTKTILSLDIEVIDDELYQMVDKNNLRQVAGWSLRGERIFPVPSVIYSNPYLLGYYRLLYGFSQKQFYQTNNFGKFKFLEEKGEMKGKIIPEIPWLCKSLIKTGESLVNGIDSCSDELIHDLQLLTIGPQLRGGRNTILGKVATEEVFNIIRSIISSYIIQSDVKNIIIKNDSNRLITIAFASDPDISISEKSSTTLHPLVSIEIKGGTDFSNIHNRIGEAEKSHQKAKSKGFHQFWTILNIDFDLNIISKESPTTTYFFSLHRIVDRKSPDFYQFRDILYLTLGIHLRKI